MTVNKGFNMETDALKTSPWVGSVTEKTRVVDNTSSGNNLIGGKGSKGSV